MTERAHCVLGCVESGAVLAQNHIERICICTLFTRSTTHRVGTVWMVKKYPLPQTTQNEQRSLRALNSPIESRHVFPLEMCERFELHPLCVCPHEVGAFGAASPWTPPPLKYSACSTLGFDIHIQHMNSAARSPLLV